MSYDFLFLAFDLSGVALRARRDWLIARRLLVLDWPAWLAGWLAVSLCVVVAWPRRPGLAR
jgi:hypothetical protein